MRVLERLPVMSGDELDRLEENAQRALTAGRDPNEAQLVVAAVAEERARRGEARRLATLAEQERIRESVADLPLEGRVERAFRDQPPSSWEVEAIRALAANGGATTDELSAKIGYSGGYMNMAFGTLCHDRQGWLGPPPAAKREGQVVYSALLVDFVEKQDAQAGRRWTEWWLKPEARNAFQLLKLLDATPVT